MGDVSSLLMAMLFILGFSSNAGQSPNIVPRTTGETRAPPPASGSLGNNYSLLQALAAGSEAELVSISPNGNFASYSKIIITPVTLGERLSHESSQDQQMLCDYFDDVLEEPFCKDFMLVDKAAPRIAKLSVALMHAVSATPVLRTISVAVRQAQA
jgi:hypothetical protein